MALDITISTPGLEYVRNILAQMPEFQHSTAFRKTWKVGGRILVKQGKQNLRKRNHTVTGNLLGSLITSVNKQGDGMHVGFKRSSRGKLVGGGNHAHLVDLGHNLVVGKDRIRTGKRTQASLFWTDVRDDTALMRRVGNVIGTEMLLAYDEWLDLKSTGSRLGNKYF